MDHNNEDTLKLLQDIKEMLLGGILLLTGGLLVIAGFVAVLAIGYGFFIFFLIGGLLLLFCGGLYLWHGWTAHEVVEHQEEAPNTKP